MKVMRDLVGDTLSGRYRMIARVAGGGMGEVYRAHDLLLDRRVAVKVLQPSLASDLELVARFKQEARAAARLTHPNVVAVYDWGAEDDVTYYMVMEFVAGTDLRDLLVGNGVLEPAQAAEIIASLCDALHAAHSTGLVHRDVKPENILIARDGVVKVADFGIAVVSDVDRTSPGGVVPGTLRYLAPEQARGEEATPASDIWAAGAVLAEALTGRPPLLGSGADLLRRRAIETPVAPSTFDRRIPRELDEIVLTACAVDPAERYPDAAQMGATLRRAAVRWLPHAAPLDSLLDDLTGEVRLPDMDPTEFGGRRKPKRRLRTRLLRAAIMLVMLAALGLGAARAAVAVFGPRSVPVPSLMGLDQDVAVDRALELGLIVDISDKRKHVRGPEGQVIGQVPSGGVVEEGTTITLYVSAGLPRNPVPALVGLELDNASRRLAARGLGLGDVTRQYSDEPKGVILEQQPSTGRLRWGSAVDVVVSRGPRPVVVPNIVGLDRDDAVTRLEQGGFVVQIVEEHHDKVDAGVVIAATPQPGTTAPDGSTITLSVSLGPKLERFRMPDVRGMTVAAARARLERLRLVVRIVRSCPGNTVVDSDPIAGRKVTEGDRVALFVC